jgi:hypothetical protein
VVDPIWSLYFTSHDTGYAIGGNYSNGTGILKTTNGGTDWISQTSGITNKSFHTVYFINSSTGFIVGDSGVILKTTNGGRLGLNEIQADHGFFKLYPNPVRDNCTFELTGSSLGTNLTIYDVEGNEVITRQIRDKLAQIDFSGCHTGIYFIKVINERMVGVKKIVKE